MSTFVPFYLDKHLPPWLAKLVCGYTGHIIDCIMCQTAECSNVARSIGSTGFRCQNHVSQPFKLGICFRIETGGRVDCVGVEAAVTTVDHIIWGMYASVHMRGSGRERHLEKLSAVEKEHHNLRRMIFSM